MGSWNDFNDAKQTTNLIPKGTLAKVHMTIRPGGFDDPAQGWTGGYATRGTTGAVYLNVEYTVLEGPFARRKVFSMIGLHSPKGPEWANMGRGFIRSILNSSRGLSDKHDTPEAQAAHAVADSYRRIIDRVLHLNPMARIYGVTATPNRGDRKGLRDIFTNVADQIRIGELIESGHLVRPRTFVIDVGVREELNKVRKTASDFDMSAVDAIMNKEPVTDQVIAHWKEHAGDRQTVVFCSTVDHAFNVAAAFRQHGVTTIVVHGEMAEADRRRLLATYDAGEAQVVVNVAVLTEGWDHPPTSCVVLLRPSSFKSTMIQMVGRGLRIVNPEEYPGVVKTDCVVLDFGTSTLLHGTLDQDVDLEGYIGEDKECPECGATVPHGTHECAGPHFAARPRRIGRGQQTALGPNFTHPRNSDRGSESRKSQNPVELTG